MLEIQVYSLLDIALLGESLETYSRLIDGNVDQEIKALTYNIRDEAKTYDAPRLPTSQRTGKMSRETVARRIGDSEWIAEMKAPYSVYVRGSMLYGQAYMHRGRWKPFERIVMEKLKEFEEHVNRALARAKDMAGL